MGTGSDIAECTNNIKSMGMTIDDIVDFYNGTKDLWSPEEHRRVDDCYNAYRFLEGQYEADITGNAKMPITHYIGTYRKWLNGYYLEHDQ